MIKHMIFQIFYVANKNIYEFRIILKHLMLTI